MKVVASKWLNSPCSSRNGNERLAAAPRFVRNLFSLAVSALGVVLLLVLVSFGKYDDNATLNNTAVLKTSTTNSDDVSATDRRLTEQSKKIEVQSDRHYPRSLLFESRLHGGVSSSRSQSTTTTNQSTTSSSTSSSWEQQPCDISIVFMGDSVTRFMYVSLAYYLLHGKWIKPKRFPSLVVPPTFLWYAKRQNRSADINSFMEFYDASTAALWTYDNCDCYRKNRVGTREGDDELCDNRYYHDPERNNTLVF